MVSERSEFDPVKKVLSILSYLPIILLGIGGAVVVVDMYNTAEVGRTKVTVIKNDQHGAPTVTPSPAASGAVSPSP
jgi:hypothetical protein